MSTKTNTGVRNHPPHVAPAGTGSGGTVNPAAAVPATSPAGTAPAGGATMEPDVGQWLYIEAASKTFREGYVPLLAAFHEAIQGIPTGGTTRAIPVLAQQKQAATLYAGLLRQYPNITSTVNPDAIDAGLAVEAALAMVKSDLEQTLPMVESCGRRAAEFSWADTRMVRSAAKDMPNKSMALTTRIASIEVLLHRGKRVSVTANSAAKAQAKALKTQQRAAADVAKAQAKAAKAARVATRAVQAHADNHPTTPDVVIVPAGTTDPNGTPPKG